MPSTHARNLIACLRFACPRTQSGAILRAEVFGIALPAYASDTKAVAQVAAKVDIPAFVPKQGVQIETDPKVRGWRARRRPASALARAQRRAAERTRCSWGR